MKKFTKVISVILIISAMLMATLMPAFAAFPEDSEAYLWLTKEKTASDPDIYKITIHLQANYPVSTGDVCVYFPKAEFKAIQNSGKKDTTARNTNTFNYLGAFADTEEYDSDEPEEQYAVGPGSSTFSPNAAAASKFFNDSVPEATYTAVRLMWASSLSSNNLYYDSSRWGDLVAEFYVQKLAGAPDNAIDNVSLRPDAPSATNIIAWSKMRTDVSGGEMKAASEKWHADTVTTRFTTLHFSAPEQEGSIVEHWKSQIRFPGAAAGNYQNKFDVRVLARISAEDFVEAFGEEDVAPSNIAKIGFIFQRTSNSDVALTVDAVKDYIENNGELDGSWLDTQDVSPVDYINNTMCPGYYVFSCFIQDIEDNSDNQHDGVNAVAYIVDKEGHAYYYSDVETVDFYGLYSRNAHGAGVPNA